MSRKHDSSNRPPDVNRPIATAPEAVLLDMVEVRGPSFELLFKAARAHAEQLLSGGRWQAKLAKRSNLVRYLFPNPSIQADELHDAVVNARIQREKVIEWNVSGVGPTQRLTHEMAELGRDAFSRAHGRGVPFGRNTSAYRKHGMRLARPATITSRDV